jgi:branched-chain amino acid transport system permease protein
MMFLIETVLSGLLTGIMYSLVALGFVLIYKASGIFNFSQGVMALFAGLTVVGFMSGTTPFTLQVNMFPPWFLNAAAVMAGAVLVHLGQRLVRRARGSNATWPSAALVFVAAALLVALVGPRLGLHALPFTQPIHVEWAMPEWVAIAATILVMILLAYVIERFVLRHLVNQEQIILFMATLGLAYVLEGAGDTIWGSDVKRVDVGLPEGASDWLLDNFGLYVEKLEIAAAVIATALVVVLAVFFQRTRIGRALRAVADDHQAALSVGISLQTIWVIVWSVSGIVALVAGIMWGAKSGIQFSLSLIALKALPVLILGGFESIPGAIVGGLIIGVGEKLAEVYFGPLVGGAVENWFAYVLALMFLLVRPQGLFGEKIIERV